MNQPARTLAISSLTLLCLAVGCAKEDGDLAENNGNLAANQVDVNEPPPATCPPAAASDGPSLVSHTLFLWPPNHKFHSISVADCVTATNACDDKLYGEFIWASSDEPEDDKGDGHHAPDIELDENCGLVRLRAERQGPKDGRVYTLGVRAVDAAGNAVEGECKVIVDHDQRGVDGADSGEAYRLTFDGSAGSRACDGQPPVTEPPTLTPPSEPPADETSQPPPAVTEEEPVGPIG